MSRNSVEQEPFIFKDNDGFVEEVDLGSGRIHGPEKSTTSKRSLVLAIVLSAIASAMLTLTIQSLYIAALSPTDVPDELVLPHLKVKTLGPVWKQFVDDPIYLNRTTNEQTKISDEAWMKLIPKGRGFVSIAKIQADADYQLPKSFFDLDISKAGQFGVSSFHQVHCLHAVVKSYFLALGKHDHDVEHTKHCLEYLRLSLMCAADSSMEPWKPDLHGVDGFGAPRNCRDYDELFRWTEEYRFNDVEA